MRDVLRDMLFPCLESAPCYVGFSGGRDSSALLALATSLARERSLEDPIPLSLRFRDRPRTDETVWQERTVEHLRLSRWEILSIADELDPLGPVATRTLRRHGLFWPPVAHRIAPLFEAARGHVLVLGTGGDESFSPWTRHPARARLPLGRRTFSSRAKRAAFNLLPEDARIRINLRRRLGLPWLRPAARREVERLLYARLQRRGGTWAQAIAKIPGSRSFELTQAIFHAMAADEGVSLVEPFFDASFLRAVGESAPDRGFPSRAAAMRLHFADVLPSEILERPSKAVFDELHGGRESRAFAEAWDGRGLDIALVDPEALRTQWLSPRPRYRSLTALNAAWLACREQPSSETI